MGTKTSSSEVLNRKPSAAEISRLAQKVEDGRELRLALKTAEKDAVRRALLDLRDDVHASARQRVMDVLHDERKDLADEIESADASERPQASPEAAAFTALLSPLESLRGLMGRGTAAGLAAFPFLGKAWDKLQDVFLATLSRFYVPPVPAAAQNAEQAQQGFFGGFFGSLRMSLMSTFFLRPLGLFAQRQLLMKEMQIVIKEQGNETGEEITIKPITDDEVDLVHREKTKRTNLKEQNVDMLVTTKLEEFIRARRKEAKQKNQSLILRIGITDLFSADGSVALPSPTTPTVSSVAPQSAPTIPPSSPAAAPTPSPASAPASPSTSSSAAAPPTPTPAVGTP